VPQYLGLVRVPTQFSALDWHIHEMLTGIEANSKQSLRCGTEALFISEFRVPFRNPNGWRRVRSQLVNARSHGCLGCY
ncbi:MAG: hypothetical protein WA770_25225, partial [Pseudolabrys sp.]